MSEWAQTEPEQEGHYWFLEPDADTPTVMRVKGGYAPFLENGWDYEPPVGSLYWSGPIMQPSAPDIISIGENKWNHDWPQTAGLYWTSHPDLGVRLARFTAEWCNWLGTDDVSYRDELNQDDFVFAERVISPLTPVATSN